MSAAGDAVGPPPPVREISTRQLGKQLSAIIAEVHETGVTIVVTRGGTPVACLGPLPVTG